MNSVPLRRRIRAAATTLSLILFPAFFYYLSPVVPMLGGSLGIVTGSLLVFLVLLLTTAFLGRGSWLAGLGFLFRRAGGVRGLELAFGLPSLRVRSKPESCVSCGRCDAACPMSLPVSRLLAAGRIASSDCILCGECVDGCAA